MTDRFWDILKNIAIVLLLLSIVCLSIMALPVSTVKTLPLPERVAALLGVQTAEPAAAAPNQQVPAAAAPLMISVNREAGRTTICRNETALTAAYDGLSDLLGRALSGAADDESITKDDFIRALDTPGVLFSFGGDIPAPALCQWLTGGSTAVDQSASDFLLVRDGRDVALMLLGPEPVRYDTALKAEALLAMLEPYTPDGSSFASATSLDPLTLWEQDVTLPLYTATNPITADLATRLATDLDFNPYGTGTYTDPAGNTVFTETNRTLSVSADGQIIITTDGDSIRRFTATDDSAVAKIELVRSVLETITQNLPVSLDQRLQLQSLSQNECTFTYVLGGVPVAPAACRATFRDRTLAELTFTLRLYTQAPEQYRLMPLSAAASISPSGARLMPAYSLTGSCGWTAR